MPGKEIDATSVVIERLIEALNKQSDGLELSARATEENTAVTRELIVRVDRLEAGFEKMADQSDKVQTKVSRLEEKMREEEAFERGINAASEKKAKSSSLSEVFSSNPWLLGMAMFLIASIIALGLFIAPSKTLDKVPVPRIESR